MRAAIQAQVLEGEHVLALLVLVEGAAQQGADAREQLAQRERLDQVVVCARVRPATRSSTVSRAVSISTGVLSPPSRRRLHTSRPSTWGIDMSRITASYGAMPSRSSAS